jgi:hypothetical protein
MKLNNNEIGRGFTDVIVLTSADLAAIAAAGGTKTIGLIPKGGGISGASISTSRTFVTAGTSTAVAANGAVSVGISGTAAKHIASAVPPATVDTAARFNSGSGWTTGIPVVIDIPTTADIPVILTVAAGTTTGAYSALDGQIVITLTIVDPVSQAF